MTVTYRKSKVFKRPIMEVFIDGPFYPNGNTPKERTANLHNQVYNAMNERIKNSNFRFIEYKQK